MKPILFNTDMVKAILAGKKTVTRRVIKPQPKSPVVCSLGVWQETIPCANGVRVFPPPYRPGDILYVRETWAFDTGDDGDEIGTGYFVYKADDLNHPDCKWRPSIHMPKTAARIFLLVKDVRVERLQDITYEDCKREGIWDDYKTHSPQYHENLARRAYPVVFAGLWDDTIKPADRATYGWDANPWVWVIEFERCASPWAEKEAAK